MDWEGWESNWEKSGADGTVDGWKKRKVEDELKI